ncbi:MAG: hypothetical protein NWF01_05525 [Candidatus Bathyarchaeota archaeon]|nr:hypothetical protein [Candidatus Bathyarchaeota archaeon]
MRKNRSKLALSNVVSEMLILVMVVILSITFIVSLQSNVSYYIKDKELTKVHVWTVTKDDTMNFTTIHSGGDPTSITGRIYFEYENGTTCTLPTTLTYNGTTETVPGDVYTEPGNFYLYNVKFGEQFQISVTLDELSHGTVYYTLSSKTQILAEVGEKI